MVTIKQILILFLLFVICIIPASADYNYSGSVDYDYAFGSSFLAPGSQAMGIAIDHGAFYHRFTDAQVLNVVTFKKNWYSTLGYTKTEVTSFSATVSGNYYGAGTISLIEQLDGDIWWSIDFSNVDIDYAETLTGTQAVILTYDTGIWSGVSLDGGLPATYGSSNLNTLTAAAPTALKSSGYSYYNSYVGDAEPNTYVSYSIDYHNDYNYSFNSVGNISSLSINRTASSSMWSVYDSTDFLYFEDTAGYSTTAIDQSFFRYSGVYANTTFSTGTGPVSIYTVIDFNGTAAEPDVPPDDDDFEYNITTDQDEYSPGDTVNVTYTTDQKGTIQVVKTISGDIYHSIGFVSGATNATWDFYIAENEPYGFYDVYLLDSSNTILDSVRYSLLPTTSSLDILQSSVDLHDTFVVFAQTVNESILSIEDPDGVEVWNESIGALMYDYIYYTPTIKTGIYTAYLYDDSTLNDTVMVYLADPPIIDDPLDPETNGSIVVEDVLGDDETMTEYYNEKFRDFAPTIWGFFMLMCLLFLMSILTSFNSGGKR